MHKAVSEGATGLVFQQMVYLSLMKQLLSRNI